MAAGTAAAAWAPTASCPVAIASATAALAAGAAPTAAARAIAWAATAATSWASASAASAPAAIWPIYLVNSISCPQPWWRGRPPGLQLPMIGRLGHRQLRPRGLARPARLLLLAGCLRHLLVVVLTVGLCRRRPLLSTCLLTACSTHTPLSRSTPWGRTLSSPMAVSYSLLGERTPLCPCMSIILTVVHSSLRAHLLHMLPRSASPASTLLVLLRANSRPLILFTCFLRAFSLSLARRTLIFTVLVRKVIPIISNLIEIPQHSLVPFAQITIFNLQIPYLFQDFGTLSHIHILAPKASCNYPQLLGRFKIASFTFTAIREESPILRYHLLLR
mmetsp:Transcript_27315/g.45080  ORF Transcript_27315/g.45080 Transcript_27315/m.45080 type:complete len:332 (-) Transcript_27315:263-1258(-)